MPREEAKILDGDQEVSWERVGLPFVVREVKGEWLDVGRWRIRKVDVIPVEDAAAYYTDYVRRDQSAEWAYTLRGVVLQDKGELEGPLKDYTDAIRIDPTYTPAYNNRGVAWCDKGDFDAAIRDFDAAIRLDPAYASAYNNRGFVWERKGELNAALSDLSEAIRLDPKYSHAFQNRGNTWRIKGRFEESLKDYTKAIELDPTYSAPYNGRAWIRATASDSKYRDGNKAVADAKRACELSSWKNADDLGTLAAAYAEAGDFGKAIEYQEMALPLYKDERASEADRERLELYRNRKPYREESQAN